MGRADGWFGEGLYTTVTRGWMQVTMSQVCRAYSFPARWNPKGHGARVNTRRSRAAPGAQGRILGADVGDGEERQCCVDHGQHLAAARFQAGEQPRVGFIESLPVSLC